MNTRDMAVIPAYEPTEELIALAQEITEAGFELLIVDDGSDALCQPVFEKLNSLPHTRVLHHAENRGKGAALKTAFQYIYINEPDITHIVTVDADGQHLVRDVKRVCQRAHSSEGIVLGCRRFAGDIPWKSRMGNKITRTVFRLTSHVKVSDTQTGLRAFSRDMLAELMEISGDRYEYEMNMLMHCGRSGIALDEVPIATVYHDQDNSCSHFRPLVDSIRIYGNILKFAGASFVSFLVDYLVFGLAVIGTEGLPYALIISNVAARITSGSLNYVLNSRAVFRDKQPVRRTLPRYIALAGAILAANTLVLSVFVDVLGLSAMPAKILTELILFSLSYLVQSKLIFRHTHKQMQKIRSKRTHTRAQESSAAPLTLHPIRKHRLAKGVSK